MLNINDHQLLPNGKGKCLVDNLSGGGAAGFESFVRIEENIAFIVCLIEFRRGRSKSSLSHSQNMHSF